MKSQEHFPFICSVCGWDSHTVSYIECRECKDCGWPEVLPE